MTRHEFYSRDEISDHLRNAHLWQERDLGVDEWHLREFDARNMNGSWLVETCDLFALHRELHELG